MHFLWLLSSSRTFSLEFEIWKQKMWVEELFAHCLGLRSLVTHHYIKTLRSGMLELFCLENIWYLKSLYTHSHCFAVPKISLIRESAKRMTHCPSWLCPNLTLKKVLTVSKTRCCCIHLLFDHVDSQEMSGHSTTLNAYQWVIIASLVFPVAHKVVSGWPTTLAKK